MTLRFTKLISLLLTVVLLLQMLPAGAFAADSLAADDSAVLQGTVQTEPVPEILLELEDRRTAHSKESYTTITEDQALTLFREDVQYFEGVVYDYMSTNNLNWNQNQFDAMVSVAYNSGPKGFRNVADKIVAGWDVQAAFTWYYTQEKAKEGGVNLGLWRRRIDEYEIYVFGTYIREDRKP